MRTAMVLSWIVIASASAGAEAAARAPASAHALALDSEHVRQSVKPVLVDLNMSADAMGRVDERSVTLSFVAKALSRHTGVKLEPQQVAVVVHLEATLKGLADAYLLGSLRLEAWPAGRAQRVLHVYPGRAQPGLGARGTAEVTQDAQLVGHSPVGLVDSTGTTGFTRGSVQDGRAIWEFQPASGATLEPGQRVAVQLLLTVGSRQQTGTLHLAIRGRVCRAIMGGCALREVPVEGLGQIALRLKPKS